MPKASCVRTRPRRYRPNARWSALGAAALLAACAGPTVVAPEQHPLRRDWVMLANPETGLDIGQAFAGSGGADPTCYSVGERDSTQPTGQSLDRLQVRWMSDRGGDLHLQLAALFGLDAEARRISRGTIRLDSVVIRRASGYAPRACGAMVEGLPTKPVITSLIGARSFVLESEDSVTLSLALDSIRARGAQLSASVQRRSGRSVEVGFSGLRWVGATYAGFEAGPEETRSLPNQRFGQWFEAAWNWYLKIEPRGPRYVVFTNRAGPDPTASGDSILDVDPGRPFALYRRGSRNEYFLARFTTTATSSQVLDVTILRRQIRECTWRTTTRRVQLERWVELRQTARPPEPGNCGG